MTTINYVNIKIVAMTNGNAEYDPRVVIVESLYAGRNSREISRFFGYGSYTALYQSARPKNSAKKVHVPRRGSYT